jgi:UDP-N-acetyl-D-mannosaminuronate dehydrogenase
MTGCATTLIVGMGEVGKPLHAILSAQDTGVIGIDIEPVEVGQPVGILHICIPFLDLAPFAKTVLGYAEKYRPQVIVINSTVAPGTTAIIEQQTGIPCVYSPVRGKHSKMVDDMYLYVKFVAGSKPEAASRVQAHFQAAGLKSEIIANSQTLELAKLLETTYFGLLIAWAQEMNRFAGAVQADFTEIGRFFAEIGYLPKVMFQPGIIGGHCVMPNIRLLEQHFQSQFLAAIQNSNEARKAEIAGTEIDTKDRLQPLPLTITR